MSTYISYHALAAMIGRKCNVSVLCKGTEAYTIEQDGRYTIVLPVLSEESLKTVIMGFAWHEIAHVKFTNFTCTKDETPCIKALTNIFEDVRIERTIVSLYPGMARDLCAARAFAFNTPFTPSEYVGINVLSYILFSVRGLADLAKQAESCLEPDLVAALAPIISGASDTHSTKDCLDLAKQVSSLLDMFNEDQQDSQDSQDEQGQDGQDQNGQSQGQNGQGQDQNGQSQGQDGQSQIPECIIGQFNKKYDLQEKINSIQKHVEHDVSGGNLATANWDSPSELIGPFTDALRYEALTVASQLTKVLHAIVQAYRLHETPRAGQGRLNPRNLFRVALNDTRIFKKNVLHNDVNAHITLLVDGSGSMDGPKAHCASLSTYALLHALRQIKNVSAEAFIFFDKSIQPLCGEKEDLRTAPLYVEAGMGCTPLGAVYGKLLERPRRTDAMQKQIIICITDGRLDDPVLFDACHTSACQCGIKTYGIGIDTPLPECIPADRQTVIKKVQDLPSALFKMLQGILV